MLELIPRRAKRGSHTLPKRFSRDCSRAVYDGEPKFGTTDPHSSRILPNCSFSSQVMSLTYDVISKPPHSHQMSQICNAANDRQFFSSKWNYQKVTSPRVLTFCISRIFHTGFLRSGQSRCIPHYTIEAAHFATWMMKSKLRRIR